MSTLEDEWRTFTPSTGDEKKKRSGRSARKDRCFGTHLQPRDSTPRHQYDPVPLMTLDHFTGDASGESAMHGIRGHFNINRNYPEQLLSTNQLNNELAAHGWSGQTYDTTGWTGQQFWDLLYEPSTRSGDQGDNKWCLGAYETFQTVPFVHNNFDEIAYYNYRLLSNIRFICGYNPVLLHPPGHYWLAFRVMIWHLNTYGAITVDPSAPVKGDVTLEQIPEPAIQDLSASKLLYTQPPMGKWVCGDFPRPDSRSGWFTHFPNVLKDVILREDGSWEELLTAGSIGVSWFYDGPSETFKCFIVYCNES